MTPTAIKSRTSGSRLIDNMGRDLRGQVCAVIGANGLVGGAVAKNLSQRGIVWRGTCRARARAGLYPVDITDRAQLEKFFGEVKPAAVFQCANLAGGVDYCESNPEVAERFHLGATKELVRLCAAFAAVFVFISTDYVFDGTKGPYREDDGPHPLNVYGRLKLDSERWIASNLPVHLIIRTANVHGWDPETVTPNYLMGLCRALADGKIVNAPSYLWGNPTYVGDLACALVELVTLGASGTFHVVGPSLVNRFEWARKASAVFGFDPSRIREVKDPPLYMVPRPLKSWLDTSAFSARCQTVLHDMEAALQLMRRDMERHAI